MDRKNGFTLKKGGLLLLFPLVSPETLKAALLRRSSTHTKKTKKKFSRSMMIKILKYLKLYRHLAPLLYFNELEVFPPPVVVPPPPEEEEEGGVDMDPLRCCCCCCVCISRANSWKLMRPSPSRSASSIIERTSWSVKGSPKLFMVSLREREDCR